jgi:L-iditol 2-dehydrogenase
VKALRLHGAGDLRVHEEADPIPAAGDELVRVTAVGLCGSDRHWFAAGGIGDATLTRPLVLGHEVAGVVDDGPRRGMRVAVDPADPCRRCELCRAGHGNLCPRLRFLGHGETDGGLRTLMAWPRHLLHPLPASITDAEATLLEPLGIALHGVDLAAPRPAMSAGVYGCGPIGLLLVQLLRAIGFGKIVATDLLPHRVDAARAMGASEARVVPVDGADLPAVDVAFEVAGEDGAVEDAVRSVRPGGRVILIGIPSRDRTSFPASPARRKGVSLMLCRRMTAPDLPRAIRLVEAGRIDLATLVSKRQALEAARAAFDALVNRRGIKIVVEPGAVPDPPADLGHGEG